MEKKVRSIEWLMSLSRAQFVAAAFAPCAKHGEAAKRKISEANKGRLKGIKRGPQSELTKEKLHLARVKGNRTVLTVTPLGTFDSRRDAARAHGVDAVTISNWVVKGKRGFYYVRDIDNAKVQLNKDKIQEKLANRISRVRHRAVITPKGEFRSVLAAAEVLGIDRSTLCYRIKRGWAGYGFKGDAISDGSMRKTKHKTVNTPLGVFEGVGEAAKQLGISASTLRDRIKSGMPGYGFKSEC